MQLGGVQQWQVAVLRFDQQADFRAPKNDCLGAPCGQRLDHPLIDLARGSAEHADTQLLIDDSVHGLALVSVGHQHGQALGGQACGEKVLLHGECRAQQTDCQRTGFYRSGTGGIGNMQERNRHGRLDTRCNPMHGVGTQHHAIRTASLQAARRILEDQRGVIPTAGMLGLFDRAEIHAVHQQLRRAQRAQLVTHALVDDAVILGAGLPAHAADKADGAHAMLLTGDVASPYPSAAQ